MILRRLAQHLREQNWTAITIEFVLLVVGVFLGIQVANWNEDRVTELKAEEFAGHLMADLRAESWRYQFLLEYYRDVRAAAQTTVDALNGRQSLDDVPLLANAYRATQYKEGVARRSTYDELLSTGNIGLIRDRTVRQISVRLYSFSTIDRLVSEGIDSEYRRWFRMHIPIEIQGLLARHCGDRVLAHGDYRDFDKVVDYPCSPDLPPELVRIAVGRLRSDEQALQLLQLRIANIDTRLYDMTENFKDVYEFLLSIAERKPVS